jgi:hypothetical protein
VAQFEVVAMALAPKRHIDAFVAHYLGKGATRVRIFYDGASDAAPVLEAGELTACDAAFWQSLDGRPDSVEHRQRKVYNHAYRDMTADWLLVVDIDEMMFGDTDLGAVLDAVPAQRESVIFCNLEAVWRANDDPSEFGATLARKAYNGPFWSWLSHALYPGAGDFFVRALLGHHMGKHAVRRGIPDIDVCIHESKRNGQPLKAARARDPRTGCLAWLLHYDAISFDAWRSKWNRRLAVDDTREMGRKRRRQQAVYAEAREKGEEAALFARLYALAPWQERTLRRLGLLLDLRCAGVRP